MDKRASLFIQPDIHCLPLQWKLSETGEFDIRHDTQAGNAIRLRNKEADVAFVTPLEYGRESSDYEIISGIGVASRRANDTVSLFFARDIRQIHSVAVDPSSAAEAVLAKIILAEEFEIEPAIIPSAAPFDQIPRKADAALLAGDASLKRSVGCARRLDLVDMWIGMTGLPYVHGFWCTRPGNLTDSARTALASAAINGAEHLYDIFGDEQITSSGLSMEQARQLFASLSFELGEDEKASIREFLHFAYYHGALPDVPDLNFTPSQADDVEPKPISPR